MSKLFIPVSTRPNQNREMTAKILKEIGSERIYLVDVPRFPFEKGEYYKQVIGDIEEQGFEVAV